MFAWERQPSEFTDISSLDEKQIRGIVRLGVERGRLSELALTEPIEDVLSKWKLTIGERPLNAATALFTKDTGMYTQFTMRLARFQGTDKNEFIDNQRVEGGIQMLSRLLFRGSRVSPMTPLMLNFISVVSVSLKSRFAR